MEVGNRFFSHLECKFCKLVYLECQIFFVGKRASTEVSFFFLAFCKIQPIIFIFM